MTVSLPCDRKLVPLPHVLLASLSTRYWFVSRTWGPRSPSQGFSRCRVLRRERRREGGGEAGADGPLEELSRLGAGRTAVDDLDGNALLWQMAAVA